MTGVCVFGGYQADYPRGAVLRRGLEEMGVVVHPCRVSERWKMPHRYPALVAQWARSRKDFEVVLVPEFRHKDVPLAALLAGTVGALCVFDPLVSRYDTRVHDRGDAGERSLQSWHNRNLDRWSMGLADLVVADTRAHAEYFAREFAPPGAPWIVVPVGYDDRVFAPAPPPPPARITVTFYGSYLPLHGVDTIVAAAARLAGDPRIHFELVGGGQTFSTAEGMARDADLGNVTFMPRVPFEELPALVARASVCLGIFGVTGKVGRVVPNKVYQCMGMARPVITADTPAIREMFDGDADLVLVPPGDADALAAAVRRLADDPALRHRVAEQGQRTVYARYRARRIAERFVEGCEDAMRRMGKGGGRR